MAKIIDDSHEMVEKAKQRTPRGHISEFCEAMVVSRRWWQCSEAVKIGRESCWPKASFYREENNSSLNSNIGGSDLTISKSNSRYQKLESMHRYLTNCDVAYSFKNQMLNRTLREC